MKNEDLLDAECILVLGKQIYFLPRATAEITKEIREYIEQLQAKIAKAIADIEEAEFGEGFEYNLNHILQELKGN